MKILITGASSKLGEKLIASLSDSDYEIIGLTHKNSIKAGIDQIYGDINDFDNLINKLPKVDLVVHLAAMTHSHKKNDYYRVNLDGTKNIIVYCASKGIDRLIYLSTRAIGESAGEYGHSKYLAEEEIRKSNLNWQILRPSEIFGLSSREGVDKLILACKNDLLIPIPGNGRYKLNPVYWQDVVAILKKLISEPVRDNMTYNICGPKDYNYADLARDLSKSYGRKKIYIYIPIWLLKLFSFFRLFIHHDQIARMVVEKSSDISLLRRDYAYNPKSIFTVLARPETANESNLKDKIK